MGQPADAHPRGESTESIVVGIPTYRRPQLLARLLRSLRPELLGEDVDVVVADNSPDASARAVVHEAASRWPGGLHHVTVADRGISHSRNALIEACGRVRPEWTAVVMLDDDGFVLPGWFAAITAASATTDADAVGAPKLGALDANATVLARNSVFGGRARGWSGPVDILDCTQNVLIRRRIIERMDAPWFDPEFGFSGGEDYAFFRRAKALGARFHWCDDAPCIEPAPPDRLTRRSLLMRSLTSGASSARVDRNYSRRGRIIVGATARALVALVRVAAARVRRRDDATGRAALDAAYQAGRAWGCVGTTPERYG